MKIISRIFGTSILPLVLLSQAFAAPPGATLNITEVFVDDPNIPTRITIVGENLLFGTNSPSVTLGGVGTLSIIGTPTNTMIEVTLPGPIPAGDYRLVVAGEDGQSQTDAYDFTIGAVGPEGPKGDPGADGADGALGAPGADGADGTDGVDGANSTVAGLPGLPGANGAEGADGTDGVDDAYGADGVAGTPGPAGPAPNTTAVAACTVPGIDRRCTATAECPAATEVVYCYSIPPF